MPQITIIIPIYNTEKYLEKCLDSICLQSLKDIEIICVNDCSTDNSLKILKKYAQRDNRIKIINFTENKGVSIARNVGINEAKGEFIGFVDSDDYISINFYEKLYNKAKEENCVCAKGNIYDIDEKTQQPTLTEFYNQNDKIAQNKFNFLYGFSSAIYKLSFIKENNIIFPKNIKYFEDPYFSIKNAIYADKIAIENDAQYFYLRHPLAATSYNNLDKQKENAQSIINILSEINKITLKKEDYCIICNFLFKSLLALCQSRKASNEYNIVAAKSMHKFLLDCKFLEDFLIYYFLEEKSLYQKNIMLKLKNKVKQNAEN